MVAKVGTLVQNTASRACEYANHVFEERFRFVIPILLFTGARLTAIQLLVDGHGWEQLFYPKWGSDAMYDLMVVSFGYLTPALPLDRWIVMPAYPALIHVILVAVFGFNNQVGTIPAFAWLTAAITSLILATVAVPVFQIIAEHAMGKVEAFNCTLLFFFFPEIFVFSSLGTSLALFLCLGLSVWLLFEKRRFTGSAVLAILVSLTELYGFAVAAMLVTRESLRKRRLLLCSLAPIFAMLLWLSYVEHESGSWVNVLTQGPRLIDFFSPLLGLSPMSFGQNQANFQPEISSYLIGFLMIVAYLSVRSFKIDFAMGTYALSMLAASAILVPAASLPTVLPLIFPLWLNLRVKSFLVTALAVGFMFLTSLVLWAVAA